MSLCAYDVNGYVGEVASLGGWRELAVWARSVGGALRDLVDTGFTTDPGALAAKLDAQTVLDATIDATRKNLAHIARYAQEVLIISDGVDTEDAEPRTAAGFDPGQPRDSHGQWAQVSDLHDRAKQAHWEAADWHRKAALNPNLGPTAFAASRKAMDLTKVAAGRDAGATEATDWAQTALGEAQLGDHGAAISAHETAGSLHRERQHAALAKMKAAAVHDTHEHLLAEERQDAIVTRELHRVRGAGSASSGNFGHAGRPGQVGGSAPSLSAKEIVEGLGMKYVDIQKLPLDLRQQIGVSRGASSDLTPEQAESLGQLKAALDSVGDGYRGVADLAKKQFIVTAGPYEPAGAQFTTVSGRGPDGTPVSLLMFNTNLHVRKELADQLKDTRVPSYPWLKAVEIIKHGGTIDEAVREESRLAWIHELGHVYDFGSNGAFTAGFQESIKSIIPKDNDPKAWAYFGNWLHQHISGYADYSIREASAEAFTRIVNHDTLPPELNRWRDTVTNTKGIR